ncbi:MAG: hypothetical protein VKO44_10250 [Cyanobacteriota bacterium]|nr:hypothetical protein [Cyanobacteriota bacterium]
MPSVRHIQELIRSGAVVNLTLFGGQELVGIIHWQDMHFLALRQSVNDPLVMVNREAITLLRALL